MDNRINGLMEYLDSAHSVFHAVEGLRNILEANGYTRLQESGKWNLVPGDKYYMTRGGASIMAFRIPEGTPKGFMMSASHADRPTFKVKENGELAGKYTRLAVERYGGMLMGTWLDRPLSIAGRVLVETEKGMQTKLVDIDRDLLLIPNVAIHMNRKANDGYAWNPAVDLLPLMGGSDAKGKLNALLEETAGGKIIGHDCICTSVRKLPSGALKRSSSPARHWTTWSVPTAAPVASWMRPHPQLSLFCVSLTAKRLALPLCRVRLLTCWRICWPGSAKHVIGI